jgi:acyl dehydratase
MTMKASVYPGGTLTGTGRVVAQAIENGRRRVELAIRLTTQEAEVCSVETTILLPLVTPNQPFSGVERQ